MEGLRRQTGAANENIKHLHFPVYVHHKNAGGQVLLTYSQRFLIKQSITEPEMPIKAAF